MTYYLSLGSRLIPITVTSDIVNAQLHSSPGTLQSALIEFDEGGNKGAVTPNKKYLKGKNIISNGSVSFVPNSACGRVTSPVVGFWLFISTYILSVPYDV